ncbi:hypothetical protein SK066_22545 [Paenibacillus hunanensis]|uniref:DUF6843 domain-containing protein n=1 Tax=Paenibacillus hunanensis TaxID=539262 RepID=UPI002A6AB2AE|nr:hypothetical protein [Paenibacillus hunanensis]WPP41298.1 hypothetical protein SK066_22545 [Paenibacillus hunanensis]
MKIKKSGVLLSTMLILAAALFFGCSQERQPYIVLIPQGYTGQVTILFDQPDAAPLTYENNKAVISVPSTGRTATSDANRSGTFEYYFVDVHGQREEIQNIPEIIHNLHTQSGTYNGQALPEMIEFEVGIETSVPSS